MKNSTGLSNIIILISFISILSSCNREIFYSCDPEIDEFVKSNLKKAEDFNKEDIVLYSIDIQKAFYSSYSVEKRISIQKEKELELKGIIENKEEKLLIGKIYEHSYSIIINQPLTQEDDIEENYQLILEGKEKFNWSDEFIYFSFFRLESVLAKFENIVSNKELLNQFRLNKKTTSCNCKLNILYISCMSEPSGSSCNEDGCTYESQIGCGILWMEKCTGICGEN